MSNLNQQNVRRGWHETATAAAAIFSALFIAVGLFFTNAANREQQRLTEQGQVTERFGRAVDQLGSGTLDIRLGGVYALERLMHDSPADEANLLEVLSAYIRDHTGAPTAPARATTSAPSSPHPATDVQAALTVIGRRPAPASHQGIDLTDTNVTGARLTRANLAGADLISMDLTRAGLAGANLTSADLTSADLTSAQLAGAHLDGADLTRAHLTRADLFDAYLAGAQLYGAYLADTQLYGAQLTYANLYGVDLTHANLTRADLTHARLIRADLTDAKVDGTDFTAADLTGALWPASAAVPNGWLRDIHSGRLKRPGT